MTMEKLVNKTPKKNLLLYEIDDVINTITTNYHMKIYCIPAKVLDILVNQIIESQPRLFYLQITLIYAHVIISEYSLEHRYIDMFMTSSID